MDSRHWSLRANTFDAVAYAGTDLAKDGPTVYSKFPPGMLGFLNDALHALLATWRDRAGTRAGWKKISGAATGYTGKIPAAYLSAENRRRTETSCFLRGSIAKGAGASRGEHSLRL